MLLQFLADFVDRRVLTELLEILVCRHLLQAQSRGKLSLYAEDGGDLTLRQNKDLEDEVISLIRSPAEAALTHHDEAGEKDGFNGHDTIEQWKGARVEVVGCMRGVQDYPGANPADMGADEPQAADESTYPISDAFRTSAASQELLLVAGDELDLFTKVR
jgi:hypothetical protein